MDFPITGHKITSFIKTYRDSIREEHVRQLKGIMNLDYISLYAELMQTITEKCNRYSAFWVFLGTYPPLATDELATAALQELYLPIRVTYFPDSVIEYDGEKAYLMFKSQPSA